MIVDLLRALAGSLHLWVLPLVAVGLVAESGLLIGVVLPGISLTVGLGMLAASGLVPPWAALVTTVAAATLGPSTGYWAARRATERRLPAALRGTAERLSARPVVSVAVGQWFAVARTLAPRLAGQALPYPRFAVVSMPVAAAWGAGTFALGHLVVTGSRTAARVVTVQQGLATAPLAGLVAVAVVAVVRARARSRSATGNADDGSGVADAE